ncbi:hypothetical protein KK062_00205 [Fulvivirgaceae bacterium PWU5]|uniref:Sialate O-acetylesterase domain-containing protein n=1 Tax=Dawidia cretensis TaxID=2782350 RepID=A0AAP2GRX7_9BACT|nr:sialate O-acetylesterase [Dawidia cretensis]MBT1706618.1 hypothetical protein [Dawidia cretensis]
MRILFTLWVLHMVGLGYAQDLQLYLLAGQSNAVGQGDSALSPVCSAGSAWEYVATHDVLVALKDPFGQDELHFQRAHTGSLAPVLAETLYRRTGKPVVLIAAARGGSSCHQLAELNDYGTWDMQGRLLLMPFAIQKVLAAERKTGKHLQGIIWVQGERDANAINDGKLTAERYRQALEGVIARFREAFGKELPFYIVQTGYYTGHPRTGFDAVRQEQEAVAAADRHTQVVYRGTTSFADKGWMHDAIHYNQTGLNHIGTAVADALVNNYRP